MENDVFTPNGLQAELERLQDLLPHNERSYEKSHLKNFERQARFMGGQTYSWAGQYAHDTRLLWLRGLCAIEGIDFEEEENTDQCEDCGDDFKMEDLESTMGVYVCTTCLEARYKYNPDYKNH